MNTKNVGGLEIRAAANGLIVQPSMDFRSDAVASAVDIHVFNDIHDLWAYIEDHFLGDSADAE